MPLPAALEGSLAPFCPLQVFCHSLMKVGQWERVVGRQKGDGEDTKRGQEGQQGDGIHSPFPGPDPAACRYRYMIHADLHQPFS